MSFLSGFCFVLYYFFLISCAVKSKPIKIEDNSAKALELCSQLQAESIFYVC